MIRQDEYAAAILNPALAAQRSATLNASLLGRALDASIYGGDGLAARIVDLPADDSVASGLSVTNDENGRIAAEFDRLKVPLKLADAARWARLYGGSAIVLIADDGRRLDEPLNVDGLKTIVDLLVVDVSVFTIAGQEVYSDAAALNFGLPKKYSVLLHGGTTGTTIHESRILEMPGDPLPAKEKAGKPFWFGRSALAGCLADLWNYRDNMRYAKAMMERKQQGVYKMTGLGELLESSSTPEDLQNGVGLVQARVDMVDTSRGLLNTIVIDGEDDYDMRDLNLSGVSDQINASKSALAASSGIPVTVLFGETSTGLNASNSGDLEGYYKLVGRVQSRQIKPTLERLTALITAQKSYLAAGPAPENWSIEFAPLWVPTDKEQAETDANKALAALREAQTRQTDLGTGAVSEMEMREHLAASGMYGLTPEKISGADPASYAKQT